MADHIRYGADDPLLTPPAGVRVAGALAGLLAYATLWAWPLSPGPAPDAAGSLQSAIEQSEAWFAAERYGEALAPTERLADEMPWHPVYPYRLAVMYDALGRHREAANAWEHVMRVSATPQDACPMVGQSHQRAGERERALAALERCVSVMEKDPDLRLALGQAYLAAERTADARREFETGLALAPNYPDLHLVLGIREFADGRVAEARARFDRFLQLAPERREEVSVWLERIAALR